MYASVRTAATFTPAVYAVVSLPPTARRVRTKGVRSRPNQASSGAAIRISPPGTPPAVEPSEVSQPVVPDTGDGA